MSGLPTEPLLLDAARRASRYRDELSRRPVTPSGPAIEALDRLGGPLPERGQDPGSVIAELDEIGSPASMASAGGRFFGFVIGGGLPVAVAANWIATSWNQNAAMEAMSPAAVRLERTALEWTRELLGLPAGCQGAFVTGATMANVTGIAAGRHEVLAHAGWDVERRGLAGAPPITVVVGEEVHVSVLRALAILGFGREQLVRVPADDQGRIRPDRLPNVKGPTIVCLQAGNVNSGAFDPAREICERAHDAEAWVHVDGAFGLWARASPARRPLAEGVEAADSWSTDAHKWLNVPYDSGLVFVRDGAVLRAALPTGAAAYLPADGAFNPYEFTPEMSRRARGVDAWAAIRTLGRVGVEDLVERCCRHASRFAEQLRGHGFRILNDVVLNQVVVSFGSDAETRDVIARVQRDGTCWCGGTVWHGTAAMRISVSSWATTTDDVDASVAAIVRAAGR